MYSKDENGKPLIKKIENVNRQSEKEDLITLLAKSDPDLYLWELENGLEADIEDAEPSGEIESSDEEEESFKWWTWDDEQNYFVLATKYKADY